MNDLKRIPLICFLLFFSLGSIGFSQKAYWKQFLPGQKVDSIVFLSTNKNQASIYHDEKARDIMYAHSMDLNDYSDYFEIYEIQKSTTDSELIATILNLFPAKGKTDYSLGRCNPIYRDCVLFYRKQKLVFAIKMCFGCNYTSSTPDTSCKYILGDKAHRAKVVDQWIAMGLVDFLKR